jgi:hypothetical protein
MAIETSVCRPAFIRTTLHIIRSAFLLAAFLISSKNCELQSRSARITSEPRDHISRRTHCASRAFGGAGSKRSLHLSNSVQVDIRLVGSII